MNGTLTLKNNSPKLRQCTVHHTWKMDKVFNLSEVKFLQDNVCC